MISIAVILDLPRSCSLAGCPFEIPPRCLRLRSSKEPHLDDFILPAH